MGTRTFFIALEELYSANVNFTLKKVSNTAREKLRLVPFFMEREFHIFVLFCDEKNA